LNTFFDNLVVAYFFLPSCIKPTYTAYTKPHFRASNWLFCPDHPRRPSPLKFCRLGRIRETAIYFKFRTNRLRVAEMWGVENRHLHWLNYRGRLYYRAIELCADELVVGGGVGWSYDRRRRRAAHFSSAAAAWLYGRRRRRRRRQTG